MTKHSLLSCGQAERDQLPQHRGFLKAFPETGTLGLEAKAGSDGGRRNMFSSVEARAVGMRERPVLKALAQLPVDSDFTQKEVESMRSVPRASY